MPQRFPSQRPIAENRCAAFFVSPVAPDSETKSPRREAMFVRCSVDFAKGGSCPSA
jgi:hypothetical protein